VWYASAMSPFDILLLVLIILAVIYLLRHI
jgi:hypothetical protein